MKCMCELASVFPLSLELPAKPKYRHNNLVICRFTYGGSCDQFNSSENGVLGLQTDNIQYKNNTIFS